MAPTDDDFLTEEFKKNFLATLTRRPASGLTEVRRDNKDNAAVASVITREFEKRVAQRDLSKKKFVHRLSEYAQACWQTMEAMHQLFLDDDQPENEKMRLDPDHWYENNLTNATLFANLTLHGLPELVPGRLFTTRMPRDIVQDLGERRDFIRRCKENDLRVVCCLTEQEEFKKYSGMDGLLEFYKNECGLIVYNRAIPDFQIPTSGDLVNNILDLTYHLSQGRNCLIHCAGGSGRTGMVVAAVFKNLGLYDPVARIRRVKSTYVETYDQELFLRNMPKAIDGRIVAESATLAKAIAAEHLIQVFYTHGGKTSGDAISKSESVSKSLGEGSQDAASLTEAYKQTFDLVDSDGSGTLDREELTSWLALCGAELDTSTLTEKLLEEGSMTRDRFASLMCATASSSRRDYDIGGSIGSGHH